MHEYETLCLRVQLEGTGVKDRRPHVVICGASVVVKHFHLNGDIRVFYRESEPLVPLWVEVLVNDATFVALLACHLELDIWVACSYSTTILGSSSTY